MSETASETEKKIQLLATASVSRQRVVGGESVAIGRFNPKDLIDMEALHKYDIHPAAAAMESEPSSLRELQKWAKRNEMLFAIRNRETGENLGFVHMTSVPEELRPDILGQGIISKEEVDWPLYDTGTFVDPETRFGKGLGSSGRRQVLLTIAAMQNKIDEVRPGVAETIYPRCVILSFVNPEDQGEKFEEVERSLLACGFEKTGKKVLYEEGKTPDAVYRLNWDKLNELIRRDGGDRVSYMSERQEQPTRKEEETKPLTKTEKKRRLARWKSLREAKKKAVGKRTW